jgi:hypothetical protein
MYLIAILEIVQPSNNFLVLLLNDGIYGNNVKHSRSRSAYSGFHS